MARRQGWGRLWASLSHYPWNGPSVFEAMEPPKAWEVWGGFLEHVSLHKLVTARQKTTLFLEQSSLFLSHFLCIYCLHLLTGDMPVSLASEYPHSVGGEWKSQTWHSWLPGARPGRQAVASCPFGSREGPAALGRAIICCLLRNCFSNKKNKAALIWQSGRGSKIH